MRRELELIEDGSPCDTNYFDKTIKNVSDAKRREKEFCPNHEKCLKYPKQCTLRYGLNVAKYVREGGDLGEELLDFFRDIVDGGKIEYWDSTDRKNFRLIKASKKVEILKAVEKFSKIVLSEKDLQYVSPICNKCDKIKSKKTVIDSGRDGFSSFSGSGKTRKRNVIYCSNCEPTPKNGSFDENTLDNFF